MAQFEIREAANTAPGVVAPDAKATSVISGFYTYNYQ